ncbi:MAG: YlxR family protein [Anaerolineae bacterium]|nr:YlxR family protein [Anaerolineae bacterium]
MTTPSRKHVPVRMCVVCREHGGKRVLTRVVRTAGGVVVDPTGKMNGRGAYLCDKASCWQRVLTSDVLARALRATLTSQDRARLTEAARQAQLALASAAPQETRR